MGGWTCSLLMRLRYFDIFREGSIKSCISRKRRWYLLGNFSQVCLSRETAPWPNPEMMLNIELKFLHSLHCRATLINCLIARIRRTKLVSPHTSVTTQNISLLTNFWMEKRKQISMASRIRRWNLLSIPLRSVTSAECRICFAVEINHPRILCFQFA